MSAYLRVPSPEELDAHIHSQSGVNEEDMDKAVLVYATDAILGIRTEYEHVGALHGQRNKGWRLESQMLIKRNGKVYDVLCVKLRSGEMKKYCYNITGFYGKLGRE
jgi:hypothetical protein